MTYFKVRNDLSVATLSKICKEIREEVIEIKEWIE